MAKFRKEDYISLQTYGQTYYKRIYRITRLNDTITLHWFQDGYSSTWIYHDDQVFYAFAKKYNVLSGGWYGEGGRWQTLKRIVGRIKCLGVTSFRTIEEPIERNYFYQEQYLAETDSGRILFKSPELGLCEVLCKDLRYTKFCRVLLHDMALDCFVDQTSNFKGELQFIGTKEAFD